MKIKVIRLEDLNELYAEWLHFRLKGETLAEFIEHTNDNNIYVWLEAQSQDLKRVNKE